MLNADPTSLPASPEARRQRAVDSLGLAVDRSHERLDVIARVARTLFAVDMSTVTVLDHDRAWFPAAAGYSGDTCPRSDTFCDRTTREDTLIVVPDATLDQRFTHLDIVSSGAIRFYAGAPLRDASGNVVGTFCLFNSTPRELEGDELVAFLDLASWAERELVASAEMSAAGRVQAAMLPSLPLQVDEWEIRGFCQPALTVGGDFFDYGLGHDVAHLGLGDVMGKGTSAALVGAGVRAAFRGTHAAVVDGLDLGLAATRVARSLADDLERAESFVTLFTCALDLPTGRARYIDAGAGLTLVVRADGSVERLTSEDRPLGIMPGDRWTQHETVLEPGDRMVVFSDGILDLLDDPLHWWERAGEMVREATDTTDLLGAVARLSRDRTPLDDVTVLAVFRDRVSAG